MKRTLPLLSLSLMLTGAAPAMAQDATTTAEDDARRAIAAFSAALKEELVAALKEGGPTNAIGVCSVEAPAVAQRVSLEQGVKLSRVALRNRNPANAPNRWQKPVLESFDARRAAGEDPAQLTWSSRAPVAGGQEFRYMQAIPTGGLCLQCHGENVDPAVTAKIVEIYPLDRATGFKEGDIRGAFVVTRR